MVLKDGRRVIHPDTQLIPHLLEQNFFVGVAPLKHLKRHKRHERHEHLEKKALGIKKPSNKGWAFKIW